MHLQEGVRHQEAFSADAVSLNTSVPYPVPENEGLLCAAAGGWVLGTGESDAGLCVLADVASAPIVPEAAALPSALWVLVPQPLW